MEHNDPYFTKPMVTLPQFAVGDKVELHNDYGAVFDLGEVTEVAFDRFRGWIYQASGSDTTWFKHSEKNLRLKA
jgi:hypothetical protein